MGTRYEDFKGDHAQYEVGDTILAFHNGEMRRFRITMKEEDIKNGEPGWEGIWIDRLPTGPGTITAWGYDYQIEAIVG